MKNDHVHNKLIKKDTVLVISFLVLSITFAFIIFHMCHSRMNHRIENTKQFMASEKNKMCYAIESRVMTAKALKIYVESQRGDVGDFDEIAGLFYMDDPALRSIQLAPDGIVTKELTYPKRDENMNYHNLFSDPKRKEEAQRSRDTGKILLSGPYDLYQGGRGVVARDPIYITDETGKKTFWGFSIVVFNVPQVFNIEHVNLLSDDTYYYRMWKYLPDSEETQVLIENTDLPLKNAIREKIEIYDAVWYLDIVPQDGWLPLRTLVMMIFVFLIILFLAMLGIASYLRVRELVYYDGLLQIGNMKALNELYDDLPDEMVETMYMIAFDIDKFKEFNYIYGTEEGDRLLKYIADTIQEEVPQIYIFRFAFDYFILMNVYDSLEQCEKQVKQILKRFNRDIEEGVIPLFEISAGIRKMYPGEPLQLIINDALIAREGIKGNLLQHYAFYDEKIRQKRLMYIEMESKLPSAIQNGEFQVYYQPKYNMITGEITGAEALVRWIKPDGTIIGPDSFIPCFEASHQITLVDELVLKTVCQKMMEMASDGLDIKPVSVNLSRVHLTDTGFLPRIDEIIREFHIEPSLLSFEITESALYEDNIPLQSIVEHLHSLGCQVDMDDYGVGVSGPKSLASYNFDTVKFDKSFVGDIHNPKIADIIRSTSHLVKQWGMKVVIEGIETRGQARQLIGLGCTSAQGYYYSRPVPEEEYRRLLKESSARLFHDDKKIELRPRFFSDEVRALFDSNLTPVYVINPQSFVVVYSNLAMQKVLGEDVTGGLCYKKMRGEDAPCKNCSAIRLYENGDGTPTEYLSRYGIWTLIQASSFRWRGREYIQISCTDITKQKELEEKLRKQAEQLEKEG